jgi:predicted esterase
MTAFSARTSILVFSSLLSIAGIASASDRDRMWTTRFLSADAAPLPDDYHANPATTTFFVVHGFRDRGDTPPFLRQARAIRHRFPQANVVLVDWCLCPKPGRGGAWFQVPLLDSLVAEAAEYARAAGAARGIGADIAAWMKARGICPSRTVVCGHSLGAQIAAYVGQECVKPERFAQPLRAILAADPAGPLFAGKPADQRLDRSDAAEVIVIHATELYGCKEPLGTADTYIVWPETDTSDPRTRHNEALELLTESILRPELANADGTPFAGNALGFHFSDSNPRTLQPARADSSSLSRNLVRSP